MTGIDDLMAQVQAKGRGPKMPPPRRQAPSRPAVSPAPVQAPDPNFGAASSNGNRRARRLVRVQLLEEQDQYLRQLLADALVEGYRVPEARVLRMAMADLMSKGGWADLRARL